VALLEKVAISTHMPMATLQLVETVLMAGAKNGTIMRLNNHLGSMIPYFKLANCHPPSPAFYFEINALPGAFGSEIDCGASGKSLRHQKA
jgi:hypothetical protein